jgi:hypothetical protein
MEYSTTNYSPKKQQREKRSGAPQATASRPGATAINHNIVENLVLACDEID